MYEICSKLTIKTPERRLAFLLLILTYFLPFSNVSIIDFKQINIYCVSGNMTFFNQLRVSVEVNLNSFFSVEADS